MLWQGPNKTITLAHDAIIDIEPFADAVRVFKDTGKPVSFLFDGPSKHLIGLVLRVVDECR
jgi:hypothetical protein